jgi:L-lactate dehydrogenase complex protein LldG
MKGKTRDRIISSLEVALRFPARDGALCTPAETPSPPGWLVPAQHWEALETQLEAVSTRLHRAHSAEEAHTLIRAILREHAVKKVVCWAHPLLEALKIDGLLRAAGVDLYLLTPGEKDFPELWAQADLGITAAEAILVDSGAVTMKAQAGQERATSILPPVHLAIITTGQLLQSVCDLAPLFREWLGKEGRLPSAIHLASGPSRTADIELTLILGAHGPKALHVLALDSASLRAEK